MADSLLPGLHSLEGRKAIAEVIVELFGRWRQSPEQQASLLGLEDISPYYAGEPLPDETPVLERAGQLLAIERALRTYFPDNPALRDEWVILPNPLLGGVSPLEVLRDDPDGARKIRALLEGGRVR